MKAGFRNENNARVRSVTKHNTRGGQLQVTGSKNVAARGDLHIHASKSWLGGLADDDQKRSRRKWKLCFAGVFTIADGALTGVLAVAPAQPVAVAALLVVGTMAFTLLSITLCGISQS